MTNSELLALAPTALSNYRKRRYLGDDLCLPVADFTAADEDRIRGLYSLLLELFGLLDRTGEISPDAQARVSGFIGQQNVSALIRSVQAFGIESYQAAPSELLAKTIHDLRGGGLTLLLNRLQFAQMGELNAEILRSLFFLTRDHLKIMRNALLGLDDEKREEDLLPKLHGIDFIAEKWKGAELGAGQRQLRLEVDSLFTGNISECCVEFGALDRILYNLINNACRHTSTDEIRLGIVALPAERDLRFVIRNGIAADDEGKLSQRDLGELFKPGVSSTGSGFGMTVAADFVANAYGLPSRETAVKKAYLGAKVMQHQFVAWFHWPIAPDI